jgi:hypothetical protein
LRVWLREDARSDGAKMLPASLAERDDDADAADEIEKRALDARELVDDDAADERRRAWRSADARAAGAGAGTSRASQGAAILCGAVRGDAEQEA